MGPISHRSAKINPNHDSRGRPVPPLPLVPTLLTTHIDPMLLSVGGEKAVLPGAMCI